MFNGYLKLGDQRVEVWYVEAEHEYAQDAFDVLQAGLPRMTDYFRPATPLPKITAVLVPNRDEFDRLVRDLLRIEIEIPSHPARIAQPQRTDMVALSPSAYAEHSTYDYVPEAFRRLLVHEMVHMMEEYLTPDMETTPRWWSEGLAVYLSGQSRYEEGFRGPAMEGVLSGAIPGFAEIDTEVRLAYDWGWTIVRFLEAEHGQEMILRIVNECADGDIFGFLGVDPSVLEQRWRRWLLDGDY